MIKDVSYEAFENLIISFLKENNILKSFEKNLIEYKDINLNKYIHNYYENNYSMNNFILGSFLWSSTKEGMCFWEIINDNYFAFLANREKEFWYD